MQDFGQIGEVTVTKDDTLMMKVSAVFKIYVRDDDGSFLKPAMKLKQFSA